jgi:membrane protease YdiL (CAAX protease family)
VGCTALPDPARYYALLAAMLFLPLFDRAWTLPRLPRKRSHIIAWSVLLAVAAIPAIWTPGYLALVLTNLLLVALPEEWFFRAYFMERAAQGWRANWLASLLFSLMHGLSRGWPTGILVFLPSLFYGWLYQRTRDLPLIILIHALSNLVFILFLAKPLTAWIAAWL